MPNLILNTFLILLLATCGTIIGTFYIQKRTNIAYVNGKLYDLEHVVEALELLDPTEQRDKAVRERLDLAVARNLLDLSTKSIDIDDLQESPINVLCRILHYHKSYSIGGEDSGNAETNTIMELLPEYLTYLEKTLRKKVDDSTTPYYHCDIFLNR